MISVDNLVVDFGATRLLENVSFVINDKDRIALVGKNGAGKSTLLKILAGEMTPTQGSVATSKSISIGYLPQVMPISDSTTVFEEAQKPFATIIALAGQIESMQKELQSRNDHETKSYQELIANYTQAQEQFGIIGGNDYKADIEKTLAGLGFKRSDLNRPTAEFSGGWRMRIELAKILLQNPDVLLLDEPTNHLDIESMQWLENFLASKAKAVMLVSHDRAFINNVTNRTIEIECGKIYDYKVKYDKFTELRKQRRQQQLRAYENQRKAIAQTEEFIERFRYKATKAVQVQSRIKQLEKLERVTIDDEDNTTISVKFPEAERSGNYPVITDQLEKAYGSHIVLKGVTITINRGEKVAFVGRNGEGKSTLVKCIMGETPFEGQLKLGHNVKIGYFAQNQAQLLDEKLTVLETVDNMAHSQTKAKTRDILGAFMFGNDAVSKKVQVLSGGERARLAMAALLMQPVNLLILDEPTNHLDMRSKEVLKQAIKNFNATAIIVSHDRDFLDGLVEKVYEFENTKVKEHIGGIYDFITKKNLQNLNELNTARKDENAAHKENSKQKNNYEERKTLNKKIKKLESQIKECEKQITSLEITLSTIENELANPQGAADNTLYAKHKQTKQEISKAMDEWEKLNNELELINKL